MFAVVEGCIGKDKKREIYSIKIEFGYNASSMAYEDHYIRFYYEVTIPAKTKEYQLARKKYEADMKQYKEDMEAYKTASKAKKIKNMEEELKKLKGD